MTQCSTVVDFKKVERALELYTAPACDIKFLLEISAFRTKRKNSVFHKCYQPTYFWQNLNFFTIHTSIIDMSL